MVLGAGGMAGHMLALRLAEKGNEVISAARRKISFCNSIVLDVRNEVILGEQLKNGSYDAVVNCVGLLTQAANRSPADAVWLNAYFPHRLSELARAVGTRVVHLSTDCVFDGRSGGYSEASRPNATDWYGRSKALGELEEAPDLTLRTSIVGPDVNAKGVGLFHWFMGQSGTVRGYTKAMWSGVTTLTLADAVHSALQQNITGLLNLTNGERISKFDLLRLFNDLRAVPVEIQPWDGYAVDKTLKSNRRDFSFRVPSYAEMVCEMGKWIRLNRELYPNYDLREEP